MFSLLLLLLLATSAILTRGEFGSCNTSGCQLTWTKLYDAGSGVSVCECGGSLAGESHYAGSCIGSQVSGGPIVTLSIQYCMTFDEDKNTTFVGKCPYNNLPFQQNTDMMNLPTNALELNNFMCNATDFIEHHFFCGQQRRQGLLCGNCESGLGPAVMSYTRQCVECRYWYGWLLYLTVCFVPATFVCFFIILFRINVLSPPLNATVLLCQVIVSYVNFAPCRFLYYAYIHRVSTLAVSILTVYGFFNMDFFVYVVPPFCISNTMSTLTVIALDYTVALYPLLLSVVIYLLIEIHDRGYVLLRWMWWPFHICLARFRRSWDVKGSVINAFATLYVMSFTKIVSTSASLMLSTGVQNVCGFFNHNVTLYYNASCVMFKECHLPYGLVMIFITSIFILLPSLFIFFNSCKFCPRPSCLQRCKSRLTHLPQEIAKIFYHSFKDGTEGSYDCRWFAGIYLVIKIAIATSQDWKSSPGPTQILVSVFALILVATFQPHTHKFFNCIDSVLFGGLAVIFILLPSGQSEHIGQVLLFFVPCLILTVLVCGHLVEWSIKFDIFCRLKQCIKRQVSRRIQNNVPVHRCDGNTEEQRLLVNKTETPVSYTEVALTH